MSWEWKPQAHKKELTRALLAGVDEAGMKVSTHIKVEFQRPITGKGFTDRTGFLRKGIQNITKEVPGGVLGQIIASANYAEHVENVAGGKYAFMLPGFMEMRKQILPIILKRARRELKS